MHQFANQGEEEKLSFLFKVNLICAPFVIFEYNTKQHGLLTRCTIQMAMAKLMKAN